MAIRDGVLPFLDSALRLFGYQPTATAASAQAPAVVAQGHRRVDQAVGDAVAVSRQDCGPGCGPPEGWLGYDDVGLPGFDATFLALTRDQVDAVCVEALLETIVVKLVDDACRDKPRLSGDNLGELTDCVPWLGERGWFEADQQAQCYSRRYGGGGVVCIVDDGRPPDQEVDLANVRDVVGFFALSKWNLVAADAGSSRVRAGWYGQRFGRPEHYIVTPDQPIRGVPLAVMDASSLAAEEVLRRGGSRWHRSRIVPRPHRDTMDLRTARSRPEWRGWGPGVVDGCLAAYLARREGALLTNEILRGSHFNVLSTPNVAHAQSTPLGTKAIDNMLAWIRGCLARSKFGGGVPITAVDTVSKIEAISHTLTGISDILREQRQYLLDTCTDYPEVVIMPGSGNSGLSGDGKEGEWQTYDANVASYRLTKLWHAGAFGGGMRQAVVLGMASKTGPTRGQVDLTVAPSWAPTRRGTSVALATARKANAEARALDKATLSLTSAAFLRHEAGLAGEPGALYASLDVDDAPLPEMPPVDGLALAPTAGASAAPGSAPPVTPAAAVAANAASSPGALPAADEAASTASDFAPLEVDPAAIEAATAAFPADIATERELAKALLMTPAAFRRWVSEQPGIQRYPVPRGTRGGARYSLGEVLAALKASAERRVDALRSM